MIARRCANRGNLSLKRYGNPVPSLILNKEGATTRWLEDEFKSSAVLVEHQKR